MNKRQRKKMFTRAFSKAYDESLKEQKKKRQVSITTVKDKYGRFYIITSLTTQVEIMKNWTDSPDEITIEGYVLNNESLGLKNET
ncbi:TPA: hypothetical protein VIO54_001178 [Streptococcus pyogenes]|uniref:Uncharacterized protein n=2 Tax=Streptococcus TaxID=1301 RepID=A0A9X8T1R4_STREQ|nr:MULTISPECIES: hypothetical protein [Streptococcus]HEQ9463605.1 hypothetical protein [Streptococcus pyogenes]WOT14449.1 hypothetical protein F6I35_0001440 [Streptococcus anginosus]SUN62187.1 Uncharacterised protein [Streptococcus dysgalactiae subsp. equisimilis]VTS20450.1 Uncharacterised protein [Streptococcus anginosus]HEQ9486037.1 hypothetical protein [Streptococcus pyogenes]